MKKKVNGIVKVEVCLYTDNQGHKFATAVGILNTPSKVEGNSPYKTNEHSSLQKEFENKVSYDLGQYIIEANNLTEKMEGKKTARVSIPNVKAYYFYSKNTDGSNFYGVRVYYGEDLDDVSNIIFLNSTNVRTLTKRNALGCFEYDPDYDKSQDIAEEKSE